jgi:hypothetical protein
VSLILPSSGDTVYAETANDHRTDELGSSLLLIFVTTFLAPSSRYQHRWLMYSYLQKPPMGFRPVPALPRPGDHGSSETIVIPAGGEREKIIFRRE